MVTVVGILGMVHDEEMRNKYNYSLNLVRKIILKFNPDIICGEVRPEDWIKYKNNRSYTGYLGPSEYRQLIIPLCEREKITFEPIDWFEDDLVNIDYFRESSKDEIEEYNGMFENIYDNMFKLAVKSDIPFNSLELDELIREKQELQGDINPTVHNIYWICRNQIMIERIKNIIDKNPDKKILCTVGAEHNYFYHEYLKDMDIKIIYPLGE